MASLLKKIYNKGKELAPEKVKKFVAPVVKPIIETIKPAVIKADKKIDRFNQIALAAAKQSKRGLIPEVKPVMSFKEALKYASSLEMNIIPYEDARGMEYAKSIISQIKGKKSLGIFIGPEGGFTEDEVKLAVEMGANVITLGHRILRTETASLAILSIVMFEIEKD